MAKRIFSLMLVLSLLTCVTACGTKSCHIADLTVSLPERYESRMGEAYAADVDFLYDNGTVVLSGIRETREAVSAAFGPVDAQGYAALSVQLHGLDSQITCRDGLWSFTYEANAEGTPLTYLCAVYEGTHSFWLVQAYCKTADFAAQEKDMWKLISSAAVK